MCQDALLNSHSSRQLGHLACRVHYKTRFRFKYIRNVVSQWHSSRIRLWNSQYCSKFRVNVCLLQYFCNWASIDADIKVSDTWFTLVIQDLVMAPQQINVQRFHHSVYGGNNWDPYILLPQHQRTLIIKWNWLLLLDHQLYSNFNLISNSSSWFYLHFDITPPPT